MRLIPRVIVIAALLAGAFTIAAEQPKVVVDVPCAHLDEAQCARYTAMAKVFVSGLFDVRLETADNRSGATCPQRSLPALERCYFERLTDRPRPIGDHVGLKTDEAVLLVFLFDRLEHANGDILGSTIVSVRGGSVTLGPFALRPAEVIGRNGSTRSVYVASAPLVAEKAFETGLTRVRRKNGPFRTSATSSIYGELAFDRSDVE